MKNKQLAFLCLFAFAGLLFVEGCKDKTVDFLPPTVVIELLKDKLFISSDTSLEQGSFMTYAYRASDDAGIAKVEITVSYDGGPRITPPNCKECLQEPESPLIFSKIFVYQSRDSMSGSEKWFFKATNTKGENAEVSVTVTNKRKIQTLTRNTLEMYNQYYNKPSYYSLNNPDGYIGTNYVDSTDYVKQSRINLLHLYDNVEMHLLCGPSSSFADKLLTGNSAPSKWKYRQKTMFRKTSYTYFGLNSMETTEKLIEEGLKTDPMQDYIGQLKEFDVLYIKLEDGTDYFVSIQSFTKYKNPGERVNIVYRGHPK